MPDDHILGTCNLMLVAGIDTTWSAIGSSLWHLAQHPEHRAQLRDDPDLWPSAIEELLRAYSPVTMARIVTEDTEYAGCPMHEGDRVLMPFPAANRDPAVFEDPDEVRLDREGNRHLAFGSGIHRCAGSNLARLEMRAALQVFLERIPEFELVDPSAVTWAGGQVHGPRRCEVRFDVAGVVTTVVEDRRVRRTKAALQQAMVELVVEQGYESISIDALAGRADVTRATFYAHYPSKAALLTAVVDHFADEVIAALESADGPDGPTVRLEVLLEQARASRDVLGIIVRGEGDGRPLRRFTERVEEVIATTWPPA